MPASRYYWRSCPALKLTFHILFNDSFGHHSALSLIRPDVNTATIRFCTQIPRANRLWVLEMFRCCHSVSLFSCVSQTPVLYPHYNDWPLAASHGAAGWEEMSLFEVSSFELQRRSRLWHVSKMEPALKRHEWRGLITVASCVRVDLGGAENGSSCRGSLWIFRCNSIWHQCLKF